MPQPLVIAKSSHNIALLPALANRHGLITGATGTGKTVTLQIMAERFSAIGVPVFMADVKGDLAGLAAAGSRARRLLLDQRDDLHPRQPARLRRLGRCRQRGVELRGRPAVVQEAREPHGAAVAAAWSEILPAVPQRGLPLAEQT